MLEKPKPEPDDPEQSKRFVDVAKELGADETGTWFDRALNVVKPGQAHDHNHGIDENKTQKR